MKVTILYLIFNPELIKVKHNIFIGLFSSLVYSFVLSLHILINC